MAKKSSTPKICVVGAGRWGINHIRTLIKLEALGGVVETNEERRTWLSKEYPEIQVLSSLGEALEKNFDGFTVATPAETHIDVAQQIILAKKGLLVEKPLALSSLEAQKLTNLAKEHDVPLMVGHVMLFHPAVMKIKELIDHGKLGKLQYIYSNRVNLGTVRKEENILWSFAPHDISIFQYFVGKEPKEVTSRGGAFVQPLIHDSTMTLLKYPDNVQGHIFVSWLHPFKEHRLVVIGDKGMISFDDASEDKSLFFYEKGIDWIEGEPVKRDGPTETIPYERSMPLTNELEYFVQCIAEKKKPELADGVNGVEVLSILERATLSLLSPEEDQDNSKDTSPIAEQDHFVHELAVVDEGSEIGEGTKIWHFSHVQSGVTIGKNCSLGQNVNVGNNVKIGNSVKIQNNVSVYEGVELEDYVFCGPSMVFTNINVPRSKYPQRGSSHYMKTLVREGASIGANATIVCGTTVGRHALIGAGAVVTKDVPDYALMVGTPARQIGWVCECGNRLDHIALAEKTEITCSKCGRKYERMQDNDNMVLKVA